MSGAGLLSLVQWLSPAFPVGSFAYSHGLEWAVAAGEVTSADSARDWIATILSEGAGRTDAILLAQAMLAEADAAGLGALAEALAASRERWVETVEQGRALAATVSAVTGRDIPALPYPVALGVAARGLGVAAEQVAALYLQAFASNLVLASVRFVPLGQTEGQAVLAGLQPVVRAVAAEAAGAGLDEIGSGAVRGDLAAMRHETMDVRIFRT
jgi:urease accessory protein